MPRREIRATHKKKREKGASDERFEKSARPDENERVVAPGRIELAPWKKIPEPS